MHGINLDLTFFKQVGDKPHSTETPFHFQGFVDNFCKSSQLCLTAAVMAPLTPPGPFNLVTAQTANECFTSVFMRASRHIPGLGEINGISHNVVPLSQGGPNLEPHPLHPHFVTNISWFSSRFLSRTCYSRVEHCSRSDVMDLECGMFQEWAPHSGVWQALITEVTVWTSRRITVIVLPESKGRGGPAG